MRRYQLNLDEEHWIAVKNILKKTKDPFLIFGGDSELQFEGVFLFNLLEGF